jgi:hypothetical protein
MNNLECTENIRGSNLKLLAAHKTRILKMEGVYQTHVHVQACLKAGYFLEAMGSNIYESYRNVVLPSKCGDNTEV